jgi:hypothetical protein
MAKLVRADSSVPGFPNGCWRSRPEEFNASKSLIRTRLIFSFLSDQTIGARQKSMESGGSELSISRAERRCTPELENINMAQRQQQQETQTLAFLNMSPAPLLLIGPRAKFREIQKSPGRRPRPESKGVSHAYASLRQMQQGY